MTDRFIDYIVECDEKKLEDLAYIKYDRVKHQTTRVYIVSYEYGVKQYVFENELPDYIILEKDEYILKPILNKDIIFPNFINEREFLKTKTHKLLYIAKNKNEQIIVTDNKISGINMFLSDGTENGFNFIYDNTNENLRVIDEL